MEKRRYLVAFAAPPGRGTELAYAYVRARSRDELSHRIPGVEILDPEPEWLSDEQKAIIGKYKQFDVDSELDVRMLTTQPDLVLDRESPPPHR